MFPVPESVRILLFLDCTVAKFNNIQHFIDEASDDMIKKAHQDEKRMALINASIDKENKKIILENLTKKNSEKIDRLTKISHGASLIELDPDNFVPEGLAEVSKAYQKFQKAAKDAQYTKLGIM